MGNTRLYRRIERLIQEREPGGAGVAVAVVDATSTIFTATFGLRDRELQLPVTERTTFEICSSTKAFTAAALVHAAEQQRVDLDAPLNKKTAHELIPLSDADASRQLSITDILSHRVGLPANDLRWCVGALDVEQLPSVLGQLPLIPGGFRASFSYNNMLYGALGHRFAELVGEPWDAYVRRTLLEPLAMRETSTAPVDSDDLAQPYTGTSRMARIDTRVVAAAGGMRSTIGDMATWMRMFLAGGAGVLSSSAISRMLSQHAPAPDANPLLFQGLPWLDGPPAYGLGWFLGATRGIAVAHHMGFIDGFSTQTVLVPSRNLGIVVLMNANLTPLPGLIAGELLAELLTMDTRRALPGRYESGTYGSIDVVDTDEQLFVVYNGHRWPLALDGVSTGTITAGAFGMQLPLPVAIDTAAGTLAIPLSLDPRVAATVFGRR